MPPLPRAPPLNTSSVLLKRSVHLLSTGSSFPSETSALSPVQRVAFGLPLAEADCDRAGSGLLNVVSDASVLLLASSPSVGWLIAFLNRSIARVATKAVFSSLLRVRHRFTASCSSRSL